MHVSWEYDDAFHDLSQGNARVRNDIKYDVIVQIQTISIVIDFRHNSNNDMLWHHFRRVYIVTTQNVLINDLLILHNIDIEIDVYSNSKFYIIRESVELQCVTTT